MTRPSMPILLITAVGLMISSARATVYLNCADLGNGVIELSYDFSEEEVRVRAFSLDIRVSSGIITSVGNCSPNYQIYPDSIYIDDYGEVVVWGTPVCPSSNPCTIGGLGTPGMTISMGSLYIGEANAPPPTGVLLTFTISSECGITIEENACRGGVVLEEPPFYAPVYAPGLQGALPSEPGVYGGGSGTADDPFLIFDANQLNTIALNPSDLYKHFKLMAHIDLSGYAGTDFNLIGTYYGYAFRGTFDGNGRKICNFTYNSPDANFVGLFGYVDGSTTEIKNVDLINPNVNAGTGGNVGSLVGYLRRGTVSRCSAQGGYVAGGSCVGGLVGRNYTASMENCFASTDVFGDENLGGLVGRTYVEISNSYSTGNVSQDANMTGALVGFNHGSISSSFWDEETSGQTNGAGGTGETAVTELTGKPTAQMQMKSTFIAAGWDFKGESTNGTDDIWTICERKTYPMLVRQRITGDFTGLDGVDFADFAVLASAWQSRPGDENWNALCDIYDPNDDIINERDLAVLADNYLTEIP